MTHGHRRKTATKRKELNSEVYRDNTQTVTYDSTSRYPRSVQIFAQETQTSSLHPTQKPVALMEYLVRTYSNENDVVLDFAMGSGTTGVACRNLGREFVGIEKEEKYFELARKRIYD
jgi:site-specific DNA-methyltransferase (adenine-specific)